MNEGGNVPEHSTAKSAGTGGVRRRVRYLGGGARKATAEALLAGSAVFGAVGIAQVAEVAKHDVQASEHDDRGLAYSREAIDHRALAEMYRSKASELLASQNNAAIEEANAMVAEQYHLASVANNAAIDSFAAEIASLDEETQALNRTTALLAGGALAYVAGVLVRPPFAHSSFNPPEDGEPETQKDDWPGVINRPTATRDGLSL